VKEDSRFLEKWKLVRAAAKDKANLSMGDISVLIAICDRYGSKYDKDAPAKAGHALLGAMSGLSRRATIDSTRRLIDAGYVFVIELGSGTAGTKYGLQFSRGEDRCTTKEKNARGEDAFTTVVKPGSLLDPLRGEDAFTESPPTESRLQASLHVVGNGFDDAASPPPTGGLKATAAVPSSGDGFDEFWSIWPRKHGLKRARAEWAKITHDVDIIISAAGDWAAHYQRHGVDRKWIPEPANWLRDGRWREDLPLIHLDAKGAAIAKAKANAPLRQAEQTPETRNVYRHVVIDGIEATRQGYSVAFAFQDAQPNEQQAMMESYDAAGAIELFKAVGLKVLRPGDEAEAIGRPLLLVVDEDDNHSFEPLFRSDENVEITYEPLPEKKSRHPSAIPPWRMVV